MADLEERIAALDADARQIIAGVVAGLEALATVARARAVLGAAEQQSRWHPRDDDERPPPPQEWGKISLGSETKTKARAKKKYFCQVPGCTRLVRSKHRCRQHGG
jgi:hypothetical protein